MLIFFAICVGSLLFISALFAAALGYLAPQLLSNRGMLFALVQALSYIATALFLWLYNQTQEGFTMRALWKDETFPQLPPWHKAAILGVIIWIVAFPIALSISNFTEALTHAFFGPSSGEQLAVTVVKLARQSTGTFILVSILVCIGAPLLEEYMFRGVLQTYVRYHWGTVPAILTSSIAFALFHFSPEQGISNISILISLFVLASFLGILYEKTRFLISPIFLHVTFNFINVIHIVLTG